MSLLIDALRKAEKEKKETAKRLKKTVDESFHDITLEQEISPGLYEEIQEGGSFVPEGGEKSFDERLPDVPVADLARDIGEENQPTPVTAQTVFAATGTYRSLPGINWPFITGALVIVFIATSVFVYKSVTPISRDLPLPLLVRGIEKLVSPQSVIDLSLGTESLTLISGRRQFVTTATEVPSGTIRPGNIEETNETTRKPEEVLVDENIIDSQIEEAVISKKNKKTAIEDEEVVVDSEEIAPSLIKISRTKKPDEQGQLVNEAFLVYQEGDFSFAKIKYEEILKSFPDNRDALLGLGAIAINGGDILQAFAAYSQLLRIDPQDAIARAALIAIQRESDLVNRESVIKLMINDNPEVSFFHFTLGNIYATQSRWADAQHAFFNAYRYDSSNPDYALNLAISLDHIGQIQTALDYYNAALNLADDRSTNFDTVNVVDRMQTLSGTVTP